MSIKTAIASTLLALSLSPAFAADQTVTFGADDTASFIGTGQILAGGDDVVTFAGLAAGTYDFQLSLSGFFINLSSLSLNGTAGTVESNGNILFADVEGNGNSPFALTLTGSPLNSQAHYSGQIAVTAVPELDAWAMLVAGLGMLGLMNRRRKAA